jgi:TPR repeat protein
MRRQDIQLLARARQGEPDACCEVGRRYLLGVDGFPQHLQSGIDYLTRAAVAASPLADRIMAESLSLEELLRLHQEPVLARAAEAGSGIARTKWGLWLWVRHNRRAECVRWFDAAAASGHAAPQQALAALDSMSDGDALPGLLQSGALGDCLDAPSVAAFAVRRVLADKDLGCLAHCLRTALALSEGSPDDLSELVVASVRLAEDSGLVLEGLDPNAIEACLDRRARRNDHHAAHALGRALCGIPCGALTPASLSSGMNMRRGVAFLMRAADAGCDDAWMHLYRAHSDRTLSVVNPQMARFCLEKAAHAGQVEAQRKLGALMLRDSESLADAEQAIQWLHRAAGANDLHAKRLLDSLVLPLDTSDEGSDAAIESIRSEDPWLAVRLQLSRQFGLTKLEALCVDPAEGLRPWGLVVGKNPFISQIRLSAARAVPAVTESAMDAARRAAAFFGQGARGDAMVFEGDLRRRSLRQRRAFERHGLNDSMFFASASSGTLEALRLGSKWALRARKPLQMALAS